MGFTKGVDYSRGQIANELGIPEDDHAVILGANSAVLAIVVAANGQHPSGKKYKNELKATTFLMHGEKDWRGGRLEQWPHPVPLFFSHGSNGNYRYEGMVKWVKTTNYAGGDPFREFVRITGE